MSPRVLAIDPCKDPGSGRLGVARFDEDGELVYVNNIIDRHPCDVVVVELPQVYLHGRMVGDPDDLIGMAFTAGRIVSLISCGEVVTVKPAEWKGQVPKDIHNARTMAKLNEYEREVLEHSGVPKHLKHNLIDAIGLGLWYLKR